MKNNMKHFKKLQADAHSTTLEHPHGHILTIAHEALDKDTRAHIDALPHYKLGGPVGENGQYNIKIDAPKQQDMSMDAQMAPAIDSLPFNANLPESGSQAELPSVEPEVSNVQPPAAPMATPAVAADPMQNALNLQMAGIKNEASALGTQGKAEEAAAKQQMQRAQQLEQDYNSHFQQLDQERQAIMKDIKDGHIDPKHYENNMSGGEKVGAAIGILLSGLGSGITGQPNMAMDYLQKQIDRDINAQIQNAHKNENLLHATMQQFGNMRDASQMLRMIYTDMYASRIAEAAAKSKDPMAQARAQQATGQLLQQVLPIQAELAKKQTVLNGLQQGNIRPEEAVQHMVPKEHQKEVFKEIEKAQIAKRSEADIMKAFDEASKDNTILRTGAGLLRTPASSKAIQALVMPIIKDNEGRVNETEIHLVNGLAPAPGDSESTIARKRQAMLDFVLAKQASPVARGYGIDLQKMESTRTTPHGVQPLNIPGYKRK